MAGPHGGRAGSVVRHFRVVSCHDPGRKSGAESEVTAVFSADLDRWQPLRARGILEVCDA